MCFQIFDIFRSYLPNRQLRKVEMELNFIQTVLPAE